MQKIKLVLGMMPYYSKKTILDTFWNWVLTLVHVN